MDEWYCFLTVYNSEWNLRHPVFTERPIPVFEEIKTNVYLILLIWFIRKSQ